MFMACLLCNSHCLPCSDTSGCSCIVVRRYNVCGLNVNWEFIRENQSPRHVERATCRLSHPQPKDVGFRLRSNIQSHPVQGWMSWAEFGCNTNCEQSPNRCISEGLFLRVAKAFVRLGLRDAGYTYIYIDDCWMERERDASRGIQADRNRFPHGISWLADQLHEMYVLSCLHALSWCCSPR